MLLKKEKFAKVYGMLAGAIDGTITFKDEKDFEEYMAPVGDKRVKDFYTFFNEWICMENKEDRDIRLLFDKKITFDQDKSTEIESIEISNLRRFTFIKFMDFIEYYSEMRYINEKKRHISDIKKIFETYLKYNDFPLHKVEKVLKENGRVTLRIICEDYSIEGDKPCLYYDLVLIEGSMVKIESINLTTISYADMITDREWGEYIVENRKGAIK